MQIRTHAERELLKAANFLGSPASFDLDILRRDSKALIQKYLTIIDFASAEVAKEEQVQMISSLVERLKGMVEVLGKVGGPPKQIGQAGPTSPVSLLCLWYVMAPCLW
jgi:hypothetical protein